MAINNIDDAVEVHGKAEAVLADPVRFHGDLLQKLAGCEFSEIPFQRSWQIMNSAEKAAEVYRIKKLSVNLNNMLLMMEREIKTLVEGHS